MTPPTWRTLAARARVIGVEVDHGSHEASLWQLGRELNRFTSWLDRKADAIILRTAVAAALEQLEKRR